MKHVDFILFCEGYESPIHRVILSQKSPFFQAAFDSDFREKYHGQMNIGETTPAALASIILYCYTNQLRTASGRAAFAGLSPYTLDKTSQVYRDKLLDIYLLADRLLLTDLAKKTCAAFVDSLAVLKEHKDPFAQNICTFLRSTSRCLPSGDAMLKPLVTAWAVTEVHDYDKDTNIYEPLLEEDESGYRAAQFIRVWKEGSNFVDAAKEVVES